MLPLLEMWNKNPVEGYSELAAGSDQSVREHSISDQEKLPMANRESKKIRKQAYT
jgi:hypothetical protein